MKLAFFVNHLHLAQRSDLLKQIFKTISSMKGIHLEATRMLLGQPSYQAVLKGTVPRHHLPPIYFFLPLKVSRETLSSPQKFTSPELQQSRFSSVAFPQYPPCSPPPFSLKALWSLDGRLLAAPWVSQAAAAPLDPEYW